MFLSDLDSSSLLCYSGMVETNWYISGRRGISWLAGHTPCSHDPKDLNLLHVPEVKVPEQVLRESSGGWDKSDV